MPFRNLLCTLIIFLYSFSGLWAQWPPPYHPSVGDKLTYQVEEGNREYNLVITLTKLAEEGISFDYATTKPDNRKGHVEIGTEALKTAMRLQILFAGGAAKLTDQTALFASAAVAKAVNKDTVILSLDGFEKGEADTFTRSKQKTNTQYARSLKMHIQVGGSIRNLSGPLLENKAGTRFLGIFTFGAHPYPLITFMKAGFMMYLLKVERKKK